MSKKIIAAIFMILLAGCGRTFDQPISTLESSTATSFVTNALPSPATLTATPNPTATPDSTKMIAGTEPLCIQKQEEPDYSNLANTYLLMEKIVEGHIYDYAMRSFPDVGTEISPNDHDPGEAQIIGIELSPNHKYIFYLECPRGTGECSYVLRSWEKEIMRFPMDEEKMHWQGWKWIDDERVMIFVDQPTDHLIVFNPFIGEQNDIHLVLPNVYHYETKIAAAVIDPSLKYVTYFTKQGTDRLVMWDTEKRRKIAEIPYAERPYGLDYFYGWSPDGRTFAVVSPGEIKNSPVEEVFLMGLDGNVQQLTHFSDQNARVSIHTPLWSPDGRFLAFWVQVSRARLATVREMTWRLVVLDVAAQKATNLCIDFSIPEFSPSVERPVWSPDSNHLAIQVIDGDNRKNRALLIVDLLAHTYTQVPTSENPIGWLQNSQ